MRGGRRIVTGIGAGGGAPRVGGPLGGGVSRTVSVSAGSTSMAWTFRRTGTPAARAAWSRARSALGPAGPSRSRTDSSA